MANNKVKNDAITSRDVDFAKWYTDVCRKAELMDYSSVKGFIIYRPYGYALWEMIQAYMDKKFKETGHENVYMPMLIPESLLQKEADHVEGFAPEVAWVTHGGEEQLSERLCIRPTSETLFCDHVKDIVHSYRDLPVYTISGVPYFVGKRLLVHSFVLLNSYGRKDILSMQQQKKQKKEQSRCLMYMQISVRTF